MSSNRGRKLFGAPILLQDWDREAEEGAAQYWELFLDLLLVGAASSIADDFKEHRNFLEFTVFYLIIINGWMLYTHHYTTRFEDSSLAHGCVLFLYVYGFGCCIVNPGFENAKAFAAGAILLRVSVLLMLINTANCIPRAQYFCLVLAVIVVMTILGLSLALVDTENKSLAVIGLWIAAGIESLCEVLLVRCLDGRRLVPINIEQSKERLGALELIMLGETVLSVVLTYRELQEDEKVDTSEYYWVLGLSFLLIFMFTLLYFHMQPTPNEHAFRRSRLHGTLALIGHKVLGLALLTVGVSTKLIVEEVLLQENMSRFASTLMGVSVGVALLILFFIRQLHYGGKSAIHFGTKVLRTGEHPDLDRLVTIWWWTVGCAWLIPFVGLATGLTTKDPLVSLAFHSGLLFVLCVVESTYSHRIEEHLSEQPDEDPEGERASLTAISATSYEGTSVSTS